MKLLEEMSGLPKKRIAEEIIHRAEFFSNLVNEKVFDNKEVSLRMKEYLYKRE